MFGLVAGAAGQEIRFDIHLPRGDGPFPVVVIVHGFKGFRNWGFFPEIAERMSQAGMAALRLDLSHNGIDPETGLDFQRLDLFEANRPSFEIADVEAVLDGLKDGSIAAGLPLRRDRFGLLGHSRGGAAVILAAQGRSDVAAVVTWAAVSRLSFGEAAEEALAAAGSWEVLNGRTGQLMRVGAPAIEESHRSDEKGELESAALKLGNSLLLVHGLADQAVPPSAAEELREASEGRAWFHPVKDADHVMNCRHPFSGPTPAFEEAIAATRKHLTALL